MMAAFAEQNRLTALENASEDGEEGGESEAKSDGAVVAYIKKTNDSDIRQNIANIQSYLKKNRRQVR